MLFLLCGGLQNYESIKIAAVGEKVACWTEGFCNADLAFNNFGASLLGLLYGSSRLIFLYSDHLEGRQILESHFVHTGTSLYAHNDVIDFHLKFVFLWKQVCQQKSQKLVPGEIFPLYGNQESCIIIIHVTWIKVFQIRHEKFVHNQRFHVVTKIAWLLANQMWTSVAIML